MRGVKTKAVSEQQPPFYVFNREGGGFVIISGEDAINPVIAYSFDNQFSVENMPLHCGTKARLSTMTALKLTDRNA